MNGELVETLKSPIEKDRTRVVGRFSADMSDAPFVFESFLFDSFYSVVTVAVW